jgi:GntR family transcriptional regulator, transcriptional repressor for pyruvate dehydrogenase complex
MTLSSQIVAQIRDALFAGELKTGDVLGSEADLSKRFGVSRVSVRDALRSLEAMGIVDIRMGAKGGATIAAGSSDRFADALAIQLVLIGVTREDLLQARAATESMTAELAATHATPEDLMELKFIIDEAEENVGDADQTVLLGQKFHLAVARAAHNEILLAQLKAMRDVLWRPGRQPGREHAKCIAHVHRELYELIAAGKASEARQLMASHVKTLRFNALDNSRFSVVTR